VTGVLLLLAVLYLTTFMEALTKPLQAGTGKGSAQWGTAAFILAVFIICVLAFTTQIVVVLGMWKCLWAPERHWAKQFIFASLTCVVMSELLAGVSYLFDGQFDLAYQVLALISVVLFVFFLRAAAACFDNSVRVWSVNLFFVLLAALVAGSYYAYYHWHYRLEDLERVFDDLRYTLKEGRIVWRDETKVIVTLNLGWLLASVWYTLLVASARGSVVRGLRLRRSPLDPEQ
jgi:hypothetical protein